MLLAFQFIFTFYCSSKQFCNIKKNIYKTNINEADRIFGNKSHQSFSTEIIIGSSVGAALTFPLCGYIIHWFGWPLVFHLSGALGTLWFILWWILVYDSPAEHPRISKEERDYIQKQIGEAISEHKVFSTFSTLLSSVSFSWTFQEKPPWGHIMRSGPIWMITFAQWGGIWGLFTLMTQAPTYLKHIHGWDIRSVIVLIFFWWLHNFNWVV